MSYFDDNGMSFDFENQIKELGSCVEFTDMENKFDYLDGYDNDMELIDEFEDYE